MHLQIFSKTANCTRPTGSFNDHVITYTNMKTIEIVSVLHGSDSGYLETMINDKTYLSAFVVVSNSEGRIFSCEAIDCLRKLRNVILWRKVKDKMMF